MLAVYRNIIVATGFLQQELLNERIKGYFAEFKKNGLAFIQEKNVITSAKSSGCEAEDGWRCGKEIFSKPLNATAIVCANDYFAFGLIKAALDAGIKVPEDISIIGNDNIWVGKYSPVTMTTIDQNLDQVAEEALKIIFKRLEDKNWENPEHVAVEGKLIIRESSGSKLSKPR